MQLATITFVLFAVGFAAVMAGDDEPCCYTDECINNWKKNPKEAKADFGKMISDRKMNGDAAKALNDKCAKPEFKNKMNEYADKCNGKTMEEVKDIMKDVKLGCKMPSKKKE